MAEPVDPVGDYLTTRGTVRRATLAVYVPGERDAWADPVPVKGSRGERRTEMRGEVAVTACTWTVTGPTPDVPLPRPPLRSKIASGGEVWEVVAVTASPANGRLHACETLLVV